jgi:hypothetical protein
MTFGTANPDAPLKITINHPASGLADATVSTAMTNIVTGGYASVFETPPTSRLKAQRVTRSTTTADISLT